MSTIEVSRSDGITTIAFNRPASLNALTTDMFADLVEITSELAADSSVRAVLVTGRGRAFCSGGDVKNMADGPIKDADTESASQTLRGWMDSARNLHEMAKPTIASICGAAAGAGLSLALACDFRILARGAVLTTAFSRIGASGDFGISYFLTQLVGAARARELLMMSPKVTAEEAFQLGLAHNVVPEELLQEETLRFAENLASGPTAAYARMKQNINRVADGATLAEAFDLEARNMIDSLKTEDHLEAARAFVEKRQPTFCGK